MIIKVLGPGCGNCIKLEKNVKQAVEELGIDASIDKVTDFKKIVEYGVMQTPGLVVDEKVKSTGKIATVEEIKKILAK